MNWLARYSSFSRYSYSVLSLGMVRHCSSSASSDLHHVKKDHCVVSMFCVMHRRLLYIHCLSIERARVSWYLFVELLTVVVIVYMTWFGCRSCVYVFIIVMISLRFLWTSEYRICRMYVLEDQEDVIFDEWSDDGPIL